MARRKRRLYDQASDLEQIVAAQLPPKASTAEPAPGGTPAEGETVIRVTRGRLRLYGQMPDPEQVGTAEQASGADPGDGDNHG